MKKRFNKKIFYYLITTFVLVLLGVIFIQENILAQQKYVLADYTGKLDEFSQERENLEAGYLEKNNLNNIESIAQELNFVRAEKIYYIRALESTVASK